MTERHIPKDSIAVDDQKLYVSRNFIGALSCSIQSNPKVVSVVLNLVSCIDDNGTVQATQAMVAQECNITLNEVTETIAHLYDIGVISSVMLSLESGGPLSCVVSPDLAGAEKPDDHV